MTFVYFIITPQVGRGSVREPNTPTETQMYFVRFGDTHDYTKRQEQYRQLNPSWSMAGNDVSSVRVDKTTGANAAPGNPNSVTVGTWMTSQIFEPRYLPADGGPEAGWYRAYKLDGSALAVLLDTGFKGYDLKVQAGRTAAINALKANGGLFDPTHATPH